MSRNAHIIRPRKLTLHVPEDVMQRLDAFLMSDRQGRVPYGAYSAFFVERTNDYLVKAAGAATDLLTELKG